MDDIQLLLIDNYDSFSFNIYQLAAINDIEIDVYRNDAVTMDELKDHAYTHMIIGPGPKRPDDSGISLSAIDYYKDKIPILGICLGMQAMAHLYGGNIIKGHPLHGRKDIISHIDIGFHQTIPSPFKAARYNSLSVTSVNKDFFDITATNNDNLIMGIRSKAYPLMEGVQYHPESFMTQYGDILMENFLDSSYE